MNIPFVDLKAQYLSIKEEIDEAIQNVINESAFIKGKYVNNFEKIYAERFGVKECISVGNGTDSLFIILKMLGIGKGDEVITVANSWISTSETISQTGAKPVFVDIEPEYFSINPALIQDNINEKTKAIVPVHLFGQPADIKQIKNICEKNNLHLVEDCAQSHFAECDKQLTGTFGIAASFSFYPGKNLGAYGDGGAIITNDPDLAAKMRMFANHGALKKHHHLIEGINSRLDGMQAAILLAKIKHIDEWTNKRIANASLYDKYLDDIKEIVIPKTRPNCKHVFHLYVIRATDRDGLKHHLENNGIETAIHYPTALPNLPAYKYLNTTPADYPVASRYQGEILSLPMFAELSEDQIKYIADKIKTYYQ